MYHTVSRFKPENIHYARGETPFMVLGAMDTPAWRKARRTWDLELFAGRYGDANADFYPHNMDEENVRPYLTSLEEAAREFRAPSGAYPSRCGSYAVMSPERCNLTQPHVFAPPSHSLHPLEQ